jgi:hypothetical protein
MMERCADLDEFFDGELAADQADRFRDHLATCERCQEVLGGRMQECVAALVPATRLERAAAPARPAAARAMAAGATAPVAAAGMAPEAAPGPVLPTIATDPRPARGCGRFLVYAAPILAAAAAVPLWLGLRSEPEFQLAISIQRDPVTERGSVAAVPRRGHSAHTRDVLRPKVQGERHQAIWVYLDERELILRCPEDARCRSADGELALELTLTARGSYAIVAVGSSGPIPAPGPTLDRTLAATRVAGVRTKVEYVAVD